MLTRFFIIITLSIIVTNLTMNSPLMIEQISLGSATEVSNLSGADSSLERKVPSTVLKTDDGQPLMVISYSALLWGLVLWISLSMNLRNSIEFRTVSLLPIMSCLADNISLIDLFMIISVLALTYWAKFKYSTLALRRAWRKLR